MSSATMTMIGLNNFASYMERDLFEKLSFPEGIDKDTAINNILLFCGENEVLYPDLNFNIEMIGMWSTKWERTFQKWLDVLAMEYNPLENTDRHEDWSDSHSSSESNSAHASDSSSGSTSGTDDVSAFNVSTYSPQSASDTNQHANAVTSSQGNHVENALDKHTGYIHGNIGTMTTQYLLREELETQRFNIYDEIAILFAREFVLAL